MFPTIGRGDRSRCRFASPLGYPAQRLNERSELSKYGFFRFLTRFIRASDLGEMECVSNPANHGSVTVPDYLKLRTNPEQLGTHVSQVGTDPGERSRLVALQCRPETGQVARRAPSEWTELAA